MEMSFDPFSKPLAGLQPADLDGLVSRGIAEGCFVEFKVQFPPKPERVARTVAAFANTYGGWFIIGVDTDPHNVAKSIPGFDPKLTPDPTATFRDIVRSHINPVPLFFTRVVTLANGKFVLVAEIPEGQDTPFVTSDGRVYRRVADAKEFIEQSDRQALDRLFDKGRRSEEQWKAFCQDKRATSKMESEPGWIGIYLAPYPPGRIFLPKIFESQFVEKAIEQSKAPVAVSESEPIAVKSVFQVGQFSHRSIILRTISKDQVAFKGETLEFFIDGSAKIFVPVHSQSFTDFVERLEQRGCKSSQASSVLTSFMNEEEKPERCPLEFFDLSESAILIGGLLQNYRELLGIHSEEYEIRWTIGLEGVWRMVPFVDSDKWAEFVKSCGMPVFQHSDARPFDSMKVTLLPKEWRNFWRGLVTLVALSFGLPASLGHSAWVRAIERGSKLEFDSDV